MKEAVDERTQRQAGGLGAWLVSRFGRRAAKLPRLRVVERIALGPRQSLALVEAEGRCFLVATSGDGAPAFHALDESCVPGVGHRTGRAVEFAACAARRGTRESEAGGAARISW